MLQPSKETLDLKNELAGGDVLLSGGDHRRLACLSLFDSTVSLADFFKEPADLFISAAMSLKIEIVLIQCLDRKAEIIYPSHAYYPSAFLRIEKPPLFLSFQGTPCWLQRPALAVVGSREPHRRTLEWMDQHLTQLLRDSPQLVVSGAARGVDQRAHLLTVRLGLPTLAFLPSGLMKIYPSSFTPMISGIVETGGAVMSEYAPDVEMRNFHFLQRNRLIAGLARVLFVVEASRKSGSLMTARLAQAGTSRICVLPSFPGDGAGSGTLELLIEGATPLRDHQDLRAVCDLEMSTG